MPTPITDPEKAKRWREANVEFASFETRLYGLAKAISRCERRIIYAGKNAEGAKRPSLRAKYHDSLSVWRGRKAEYVAELKQLLEGQ